VLGGAGDYSRGDSRLHAVGANASDSAYFATSGISQMPVQKLLQKRKLACNAFEKVMLKTKTCIGLV
jgi:hypothetical protein